MVPQRSNGQALYEQVADHISSLVAKGTLDSGQRVPSVRTLSRQLSVSITTVLEAYRLLENKGVVEARPQSGFYVRGMGFRQIQRTGSTPPEPTTAPLPMKPSKVRCADLAVRLMNESRTRNVIPFGTAVPCPSFLPVQQLHRLLSRNLRQYPVEASQYSFPPGLERLRREIAKREMYAGSSVGPDDIIITSGATEAVLLSLRAVCEPGGTVAIESPCYFGLYQILELLAIKAIEVNTNPRTGICIDSLRTLLDRGLPIKAVVTVPNVQNPMGGIMPDDNKRQLAELLGRRKIPIIEDDTYGDLVFNQERPKSVQAFDNYGNVLHCGSFSKTLAPGYRIGWVSPAPAFMEEVRKLKFVSSAATATPTQMAVADFLSSGGFDRHLRRLRTVYEEHLIRIAESIARHFPDGTKATRPAGGHLLWIELPKSVDSLKLHEEAMSKGISIAPGPLFSASERFLNFIRLNCAVPWSEQIDKAVQTLGKLIREQMQS